MDVFGETYFSWGWWQLWTGMFEKGWSPRNDTLHVELDLASFNWPSRVKLTYHKWDLNLGMKDSFSLYHPRRPNWSSMQTKGQVSLDWWGRWEHQECLVHKLKQNRLAKCKNRAILEMAWLMYVSFKSHDVSWWRPFHKLEKNRVAKCKNKDILEMAWCMLHS